MRRFILVFLTIKSLDCLTANQMVDERLNFFDIDLLKHTTEERPGNVVVSPASMRLVLAMLLEGAAGKTAMEIMSALRVPPNKDDIREQMNVLLTALKVNSTITQLEFANGMFVSDTLVLNKDYEMMLKNVTDVRQSTDVILTNAIYFKSSWKHKFNPRDTRAECFYTNGICRNAAMMELQAELKYGFVEKLQAHAVELPYADNKYSMVLLVPLRKLGLTNLISDLPFMNLAQIYNIMYPSDMGLSLPKFTVDFSEEMVPFLQNMRIIELFTDSANLSGIFEGHSSLVSNVYHKVHLEVGEEGTVAAAATGAVIMPVMGLRLWLKVDRPFLFFVRDNDLGSVIFEGKIEEPTSFVATAQNGVPETNLKSATFKKARKI